MSRPVRLPSHLSPAEVRAVAEFVKHARTLLGEALLEIWLFGSRARGEGNPDSDVDLLLVVTAGGRSLRHGVYDLAFDIQLGHGIRIAPMVVEKQRLEELRSRQRRIVTEIDRDGILL
jgi:predicted nucleotidyltransferase